MRFCLLVAVAALSSCRQPVEKTMAASSAPAQVLQAKRVHTNAFDHTRSEHAKISCESCHARGGIENVSAIEPRFPPHTACSPCHSSENYLDPATTEPLCATCHPAGQILDASLNTRLSPFPAKLNQFGVSAFSHRMHMDDAKMSPHPNPYACEFCHTGGAGFAAKSFPAHAECYSCHIHQATQKLGRCQDCHALSGESLAFSHTGGAAAADYNFQHSGHTKRKDGTAIACTSCHGLSPGKARVSDISLVEPVRGQRHSSTCWGTCHIQKEETRCGKCHIRGVPLPVRAG